MYKAYFIDKIVLTKGNKMEYLIKNKCYEMTKEQLLAEVKKLASDTDGLSLYVEILETLLKGTKEFMELDNKLTKE